MAFCSMNLQKKNYLASGDQENVKQCRRPMVVVVNYYGPAVNEFTDQSTVYTQCTRKVFQLLRVVNCYKASSDIATDIFFWYDISAVSF